jgi:hypothetical protein
MSELVSIYESVARRLGDIFAKGVPTNCTGTTFESNVLIHRQETQLRGKEMYLYYGNGAGQARIVASFAPAVGSARVIFEQMFDTVPSSNSEFLIFDKFRTEDYENAVNRAIGMAKLKYLQDMYATISISGTQNEYPVPSGLAFIDKIRFVPSTGSDYSADNNITSVYELQQRYWNIEGNPDGSRSIVFDSRKISVGNFNGQVCRLDGQSRPDFTGTQIPSELQEFVITFAAMEMASSKDGNEWSRRFYMLRDALYGRSDAYNSSPGLEDMLFKQARGKAV